MSPFALKFLKLLLTRTLEGLVSLGFFRENLSLIQTFIIPPDNPRRDLVSYS